MSWNLKRVRQCAKCPWKVSTDPREIPHGYSEDLHRGLASTIAMSGSLVDNGRRMACHEHPPGEEAHCVGWLMNQLGPGNNIALRLAMRDCANIGTVTLDGPQHERFEDTLPRAQSPDLDIHRIILSARIGSERKAAQEDTCGPFAAALYDALTEQGLPATLKTASLHILPGQESQWHHAVVEVDGRLFDSLGEFSHYIVRRRLKLHRSVETRIALKPDVRDACYEDELSELHAFLLKQIRKAINGADRRLRP